MSDIIKPTIGRRVWYWPTTTDLGQIDRANGDPSVMEAFDPAQPCDAGIAYVWSDRMVNLTVADHNGNMHRRCSVILAQPGEERPNGAHATWMPYQVGQAKPEAQAQQPETQADRAER